MKTKKDIVPLWPSDDYIEFIKKKVEAAGGNKITLSKGEIDKRKNEIWNSYIKFNTIALSPANLIEYLNLNIGKNDKKTENKVGVFDKDIKKIDECFRKLCEIEVEIGKERYTLVQYFEKIEEDTGFIKNNAKKVFEEKIAEQLFGTSNIDSECGWTFLDFTITLGVGQEKLSRIIQLLKQAQSIKDKDIELALRRTKKKEKELESKLVAKMLLKTFSSWFKDNVILSDRQSTKEFMSALSKSFSEIYDNGFNRFRNAVLIYDFLKTNGDENGLKLFLNLLILEYLERKKGSQKAREGVEYQKILKEYLSREGIPSEIKKEESKKETKKDKTQEREWDLYIPNKSNPKVVIEVMYLTTTSSGQTTKVDRIARSIPKGQKVYILLDGVGFIARQQDALKYLTYIRNIEKKKNYDIVDIIDEFLLSGVKIFTFHKDSLEAVVKDIKEFLEHKSNKKNTLSSFPNMSNQKPLTLWLKSK